MNRFKKNIIFPKNLKLKKGLNIALVGSGNMAFEYAKVIKSFYHNIDAIVGGNNKNKSDLIKKYNIKNDFKSLEAAIINSKNIDAWIICTSWHKLNSYFKLSLKHKLNFIMEKSMIASSAELIKVSSQLSKKDKQNFFISYNRVFYDYVPLLTSILQKNSIDQINVNMPDPFKKILKGKKKSLKQHLILFITSHWVSLIIKMLKILKMNIDFENYIKFSQKSNKGSKTLILKIKKNKKNIPLIFSLMPDNASNTNISIYSGKMHIQLSPIEKMKINYDLKKIRIKKQNFYKPASYIFNVDNRYKPGFRHMYFDFIESCVLKKKQSLFGTNIDDLIDIYKVCEILKNDKEILWKKI
tara:strand:+ start:359 stop:1423 length:1065 start_codon:yes stop_codon:yes gene_type:complete